MDYRTTVEEVGALARFFPGWSRADLMNLPVRERRYWMDWAAYVVAQQRRTQNGS